MSDSLGARLPILDEEAWLTMVLAMLAKAVHELTSVDPSQEIDVSVEPDGCYRLEYSFGQDRFSMSTEIKINPISPGWFQSFYVRADACEGGDGVLLLLVKYPLLEENAHSVDTLPQAGYVCVETEHDYLLLRNVIDALTDFTQ